ncbi:hepatocyte growth factor-regulated tyrosine kinase substrate isoform X3 [Sus scrofa]|uniref:Hepatocyte growth factor-regulated tyrosine kinase substrate n=2 Tax=Sus scrofa TaxID=9823 RepID=A0A8W4FLX2_PIG|nr:hepatocyte growth factor-regulated tyrosine kinase substrate isoform X3 [Sus scrofa]
MRWPGRGLPVRGRSGSGGGACWLWPGQARADTDELASSPRSPSVSHEDLWSSLGLLRVRASELRTPDFKSPGKYGWLECGTGAGGAPGLACAGLDLAGARPGSVGGPGLGDGPAPAAGAGGGGARGLSCRLRVGGGSWRGLARLETRMPGWHAAVTGLSFPGHVFPEFKESDAMFAAERAPDWVDAEECHRCRVQFGVMTRKHHCRACGQIFCGKCSSRCSTIPKFGIEKEVRVCEPCYEQLNKKAEGKAASTELPPEYLTSPLSQQSQLPPKRDETALQEEEELQLALALSQSEAEEKERTRQKSAYAAYPKAEPASVASSAPPASSLYSSPVNSSAPLAEDIDPELARYLNRNYWEKKQEEARKSPTPSAPVPLAEPAAQPGEGHAVPASVETPLPEGDPQPVTPAGGPFGEYQNGESEESHAQFLKALQNAVSTFVNRVRSNHVRGRSITNDSAVLSLFQSINGMHPQLLELLNQLDERRLYYEGLQDKLAQIRDARGALSALREEHREKLRRAAEEAERQRQIQLAQKLEIMRQKKQEYLEVQRQLAIQRLQEQEKERQLRLEQQKQTIQMRAQMPAFSLPYAQLQAMPTAGGVLYQPSGPASFAGTFSPAGSVEGSPMHTVYMSQPAPAAGGPYPSLPGAAADPSMVGAYMYPAGATGAQTAPPGPAGPTASPAYSSYQPSPAQAYQNVASQPPQSLPAVSQPPQAGALGYVGGQAVSVGYQPYGMQGLLTALPGQDAPLPPPQQPYLTGQQPVYQQMAPSGGPPQQQPPVAQQPPAQGPPAQGSEAQLISFD